MTFSKLTPFEWRCGRVSGRFSRFLVQKCFVAVATGFREPVPRGPFRRVRFENDCLRGLQPTRSNTNNYHDDVDDHVNDLAESVHP